MCTAFLSQQKVGMGRKRLASREFTYRESREKQVNREKTRWQRWYEVRLEKDLKKKISTLLDVTEALDSKK